MQVLRGRGWGGGVFCGGGVFGAGMTRFFYDFEGRIGAVWVHFGAGLRWIEVGFFNELASRPPGEGYFFMQYPITLSLTWVKVGLADAL